jgi:hypothetical protein
MCEKIHLPIMYFFGRGQNLVLLEVSLDNVVVATCKTKTR